FLFFSSRRRHTRWPRDWSSDVCSSDLRSAGEVLLGVVDDRIGPQPAHHLDVARPADPGDVRSPEGPGDLDGEGADTPRSAVDQRSEERRVGKECRSRWLAWCDTKVKYR